MNDADIENDLRKILRPAQPTSELQKRIGQELSPRAPQSQVMAGRSTPFFAAGFFSRLLRDFAWACAGAAAALTALAHLPAKQAPVNEPRETSAPVVQASTPVAQTNAFEHDETTQDLDSAENSDELVQTDDGPAREVRYSYRERLAWSNPRTGARVVLEVPREDTYIVPVSLQ